jgi:DNA invertase Pin-like site-specific DNA recombinase
LIVRKARQREPAQVQQLKADGMGPSQIAKHLGIGRASVYRALEA